MQHPCLVREAGPRHGSSEEAAEAVGIRFNEPRGQSVSWQMMEEAEGVFLEEMESDQGLRSEWAGSASTGEEPKAEVEGSVSIWLGQREDELEGRGHSDKAGGRLVGSISWPVGGA